MGRAAYQVVVDEGGRVLLPADLRERLNIEADSQLLLIEAPGGVLLFTREQALDVVRESVGDHDLVGELLAERRRAAALDDR